MTDLEQLLSKFSDITPTDISEGPDAVAPIAFPPDYIQAYSILVSLMTLGELSGRAFDLTTWIINANNFHYQCWSYRRSIIMSLEAENKISLIDSDFEYTSALIRETPKCYQTWCHRQWLVETCDCFDKEFTFILEVLRDDEKNYHAWSHRQWVVENYYDARDEQAWMKELEFTEEMIRADYMNNSAWSYRFFLINSDPDRCIHLKNRINTEFAYVSESIILFSENESSWNYLRGLINYYMDNVFDPKISQEVFF